MSTLNGKSSEQILGIAGYYTHFLALLGLKAFAYSSDARWWKVRTALSGLKLAGDLDGNFNPVPPLTNTAGEFDAWKAAVNQEIIKASGMEADDLPDYDYWNAWDSGVEPKECALEVIDAAMEY